MPSTGTALSPTTRPGVVTFIAVIMYVQAALAAIAAVSLIIWRNDVLDWLIAHHVGGLVYRAVFSLFIGAFVLWALWGNDQSARYFEENG